MTGVPTGLLVAGGGLFGLATFTVVALTVLVRAERRQARLVAVVGPLWPAGSVSAPHGRRGRLSAAPLVVRLCRLMGIDRDRLGAYPVRWWLVLLVALPLARAGAGLAATLLGDIVLLGTLPLWIGLCRAAFGWMDERRREILVRQFPDALGLVTRAVRVGIPVSEAVRAVAREAPTETAAEFRAIADRLAIGMPLDQALTETAHRNGVSEYRFFATALALQAQTGGGLSETLENLADVIRKRVALRQRGYALASEARTSAIILGALPFFTGGVLALLNPDYLGLLFTDPTGQKILGAACGLLLVGILIMRSMIKRSLS